MSLCISASLSRCRHGRRQESPVSPGLRTKSSLVEVKPFPELGCVLPSPERADGGRTAFGGESVLELSLNMEKAAVKGGRTPLKMEGDWGQRGRKGWLHQTCKAT